VNHDEARAVIATGLRQIAPEADLGDVDPSRSLQDELDLDSMDFLNLMVAVHEQTGVEVPERDYPTVASLDGLIGYLLEHGAA
jgi:acyl carrier protein